MFCAHCAGGGALTNAAEPHAEELAAAMACGARGGDALKRGAGAFTRAGGGDHARDCGSCALALAGVAPLASDVGVSLDDVISAQGLRAGMQGAAAAGALAAAEPAADAEEVAEAAAEHGADGIADDCEQDFEKSRAHSPQRLPTKWAGACREHATCSVLLLCSAFLCRGGPNACMPSLLGCIGTQAGWGHTCGPPGAL